MGWIKRLVELERMERLRAERAHADQESAAWVRDQIHTLTTKFVEMERDLAAAENYAESANRATGDLGAKVIAANNLAETHARLLNDAHAAIDGLNARVGTIGKKAMTKLNARVDEISNRTPQAKVVEANRAVGELGAKVIGLSNRTAGEIGRLSDRLDDIERWIADE